MLSLRHDEQSQLKATDRSFANTSFRPFSWNGNNHIWDRSSTSSIPGNVTATYKDGKTANSTSSIAFNPYLKANGNCGPMQQPSYNNTATAQNCGFDSTSTIEIVPESRRDSVFAKGTWQATDSIQVFAGRLLAPGPDRAYRTERHLDFGGQGLEPVQQLRPSLPDRCQDANLTAASISYRTYDWGTRDSQTITESKNFVIGAEGEIGAWSFGTGLAWSQERDRRALHRRLHQERRVPQHAGQQPVQPVPAGWPAKRRHQEADRQLGVQRFDP
jgi:iron complex outermembrane receptor protein